MSLEWTPHVQQVSSPKYGESKLDKLLGAVKTFLRQALYRIFFCSGHSSCPTLSGYPARNINELIRITGGLVQVYF